MSAPVALPPAPYSALRLDRASGRRTDDEWLSSVRYDARARVRPLHGDDCLIRDGTPVVCDAAGFGPDDDLVLLGLDDDGVGQFAVDLSSRPLEHAIERYGADATASVRVLYPALPPDEAALLAYARGVLHWNRQHRYCGRCGAATVTRGGGHQRTCSACEQVLFPRIEPAIIALVESADARRCLLARHRASTTGGFSLLAGFVEIGESLEDAVRREIDEEVGVALGEVRYAGSQPWPFPSGLMLAFRATARDESIEVDGDEIVDARWFTRDEVAAVPTGRPDSIDRLLLGAWLDETGPLTR